MSWTYIIFVVFIVVVIALIALAISKKGKFKYEKLDALFTPAERVFLSVLKLAVVDKLEIYGKVRVADVLTPKKRREVSDWQRSFNKISAKHFDFVLCEKESLTPVCAVELNDRSHNTKERKARDEFLVGACKTADFPLVMITARASYQVSEVREALSEYMTDKNLRKIEKLKIESKSKEKRLAKTCPKCSSDLVVKVARKGNNIGNEFLACSAFPQCRHTESKSA